LCAATNPTDSSTSRCWEIAERVTGNSAAISLTVRGRGASSCRIRRLVGSAAAESASVTQIR
jgi:hypothetical protein